MFYLDLFSLFTSHRLHPWIVPPRGVLCVAQSPFFNSVNRADAGLCKP
jgi:hypothetical protein